MLTHDSARGLELATRMLEHLAPGPAASAEDDTVPRITAVLLDLAPAKAWPRIALVLRSQAGRGVFERVVDEHRSVGADLADEPLSDLLRILFALFAPQDDPPLRSGAHFVSPREQLGRLRDGLLAVLAQRGTDVAVATIAELQAAHSDVPNLRFRLRDAREARRARWPAPSPGDIVRLAHKTDARIVMSAEHLKQLLVASLRRAEAALQGMPPRARELWNQQPLTPKDEGALSDWLQGWFDQDLLVGGRFVGRELQVRPSASGRGRGEDVDLTVSATVGEHVQDAGTVAVRIEVKGCWHPDLETAMEEQLSVRYLHPVSQPHGIYVIGAFDAAAWADGDRRRGPCRRRRVLDVRERFDRQATEVSAARGVKVVAVVLDVTFPPRDATEEAPALGAA